MTKNFVLVLAFLGVMPTYAFAEGVWQQVSDKSDCVIWRSHPQPNDTNRWSGKCVNGKAEGEGKLERVFDGKWSPSIYTGMMRAGKMDGFGTMVWPKGYKYEGNWRGGKRQGSGEMTMPKGENYKGSFKDGQFDGIGTKVFASGDKYIGGWKRGKYNGQGIYLKKMNSGIYSAEGTFKDGQLNGFGVTKFPNGNRHEGQYRDGQRNGEGVFYSARGWKCQGIWAPAGLVSVGVGTSPNGQIGECYNTGNNSIAYRK